MKKIIAILLLIPIFCGAQEVEEYKGYGGTGAGIGYDKSIFDTYKPEFLEGIYWDIYTLANEIIIGNTHSGYIENNFNQGHKYDFSNKDFRYLSVVIKKEGIYKKHPFGVSDMFNISEDLRELLFLVPVNRGFEWKGETPASRSSRKYGSYRFKAYKNCKDNIVVEIHFYSDDLIQIDMFWYDKSIRHRANYLKECDLNKQ